MKALKRKIKNPVFFVILALPALLFLFFKAAVHFVSKKFHAC